MGCLGCGCFGALVLMGAPRIGFMFMWLFTSMVNNAFRFWSQPQWLWPLLGVLILPWTSIMFVFTVNPVTGQLGLWGWLWVALGFVIDISSWGGSGYQGRKGLQSGT